jgi:8-oxo-dGTP pyrophosphatase MutT (NUDIX family)
MHDAISTLHAALHAYGTRWPEEASTVHLFRDFLAESPMAFERSHPSGHFTGSAWLASADGTHVLLTHHRKLDRWLQLGGHADGDHDIARVALREAEEESGLAGLVVEPALFDLDRHLIPARGEEPAHWHYDVRLVVRAAAGAEDFVVSAESHALAWRAVDELVEDAGVDESVRRMARKWLQRDGRVRSSRPAELFRS